MIFALFLLSACSPKENSVQVIEMQEPLQFGFSMTVNGSDVKSTVFATYCQNDTLELTIISNKIDLLTFPVQLQSFEANDFVYVTGINREDTWGYGEQVLDEEITGLSGLTTLFSEAILSIEANNGEIIVGSSEGELTGLGSDGNLVTFPYSFNFTSDIVQKSDYCP